jgi:hypothetical protein
MVRRGTDDGTERKTYRLNWGASRFQPILDRRVKTLQDEANKPEGGPRVSDEAISKGGVRYPV